MSLRIVASAICIMALLCYGLPSVIGFFSVSVPDFTSFIPTVVGLLIVMMSALWLAIDGWGEEHALKTVSLSVAGVLTLYFAVDVIGLMGWFSIALPGFVMAIRSWLYVVAAVLLLIGLWAYQ